MEFGPNGPFSGSRWPDPGVSRVQDTHFVISPNLHNFTPEDDFWHSFCLENILETLRWVLKSKNEKCNPAYRLNGGNPLICFSRLVLAVRVHSMSFQVHKSFQFLRPNYLCVCVGGGGGGEWYYLQVGISILNRLMKHIINYLNR